MDSTKNTIGAILFIVILLVFAIGGYFFMNYMLDGFENENNSSGVTELREIRIDSTKDYIYYENDEDILEEEHIEKMDVVINIKGFEDINESLALELSEYASQFVYIDEVEDSTCYNSANLYSFPYREYENTAYGNYISLVINDFTYYCDLGSRINNIKSYVINKTTGEAYTEEELLEEFGITEDDIIEQVRDRLEDTQILTEGVQVIDIEGTIENIENGEYGVVKALTVSKNGKLVINFIVKSNVINYNDSIELN